MPLALQASDGSASTVGQLNEPQMLPALTWKLLPDAAAASITQVAMGEVNECEKPGWSLFVTVICAVPFLSAPSMPLEISSACPPSEMWPLNLKLPETAQCTVEPSWPSMSLCRYRFG